jgi:hypothetical protein
MPASMRPGARLIVEWLVIKRAPIICLLASRVKMFQALDFTPR